MVEAVDFSPNGQWLVSGGSDGALKLWDFKEGRELTELIQANEDAEFTHSIQFSPDGQRLAIGTSKRVRLLEFGNGYRLRSNRSLKSHMDTSSPSRSAVTAVAGVRELRYDREAMGRQQRARDPDAPGSHELGERRGLQPLREMDRLRRSRRSP